LWLMHDFGGWGMLFGGISMFLIWGSIIALIVWGIVRFTKRDDSHISDTPLELAKKRYARGEIEKNQFEQIKKDLQ